MKDMPMTYPTEFKIKARKDDVLVFSAPIKESREMAVKDMKRGEKIKLEWLKSESDKVQIFVQQMPRFPFGNIIDWLVQNIRYPKRALEEKREGKVFVQYIVERDGSISNVRVLYNKSTPHFDLQEEAMRVVRSMPHWIPGVVNGRTVRVSYTLPINFTLQ